MSKNIQNLVFFMEPSGDEHKISLKGGNMCLNRFSIDEDAAFELSGVHFLEKSSWDMSWTIVYKDERKSKGKGYFS